MEYSYIRVSSRDQCEDRQKNAMLALGVPEEQIYLDKQSGKDFNRERYRALMNVLKPGDVIYLKSIDRLGRSYDEIQKQWRTLTKERGIDIVVLDMPMLDTRIGKNLLGTFIADLVLQILSFFAEHERTNIRSRQAEGIAAARARGVRFGRPAITPPDNFGEMVKLWESGKCPVSDVLTQTGLSEATFYRRLREHRMMRKK